MFWEKKLGYCKQYPSKYFTRLNDDDSPNAVNFVYGLLHGFYVLLGSAVGEVAYISVSHSAERVAVMFSHTRCGVDIEAIDRNFARVASRYITPEERATAEADFAEGVFEAVVWSAKEAIYKYGNTQGVDFTADLLLVGHDKELCTLQAELYGVPVPDVHYLLLPDNQVLCYLAG